MHSPKFWSLAKKKKSETEDDKEDSVKGYDLKDLNNNCNEMNCYVNNVEIEK